ncbi:MAG: transposase [Deinococcota bacterium]
MKFSTKNETAEDIKVESVQPFFGEAWEQALARLPSSIDLEESARSAKALLRRREVKSAVDLLRLVLAYTVCDWSLRLVGAWYALIGLGSLSDVAVLKRVRGCQAWLGRLIFAILQARRVQLVQRVGVRLRIMDGTAVSQPGSPGTDWRVHLSLDLGGLCLDGVEVTDDRTGETFVHCPTRPGDIRVGDRGYAFAGSIGPVLASEGWLVVRIDWQNLRLEKPEGMRVDLSAHLQQMCLAEPVREQAVYLNTPQGRFALRWIIAALPQEVADQARRRLRKRYRKKGKTPDQRTLLAAGFILLLTNLPSQEWPAKEVLKLYRIRWQVEVCIKRLKSILRLDQVRAQHPKLAQVYLLGKLLAALLVDELVQQAQRQCPAWFGMTERPVSLWRLTTLFFDGLRDAVRGTITLPMVLEALPSLRRFLCDTPRKRPQQLTHARALLARLSGC